MKLPTLSRILVLVGALLMGGMYVLPLWRVDLGAPQYPEGLGLLIRINTVEGQQPHHLANINSLNHYIGMRPIEPDAIPELQYMPWVLAGLIAFGVATAMVARRGMLWAWLLTLATAGAAGLYDFWRWGHDYGHNLDEATAIIKVPGMTYSPPVIGTKQLLNFTATSLPDTGAYLAGLAFLVGALALWLSYRARPTAMSATASTSTMKRVMHAAALAAAVAVVPLAAACTTASAPVRYGEDSCGYCRMVITDARFGGTVVTTHGRSQQFDALECLLAYVRALPEPARAVLVADFLNPGQMLPVDGAVFVRAGSVNGPMGAGWVAVAPGSESRLGDAGLVTRHYTELLADRELTSRSHHHGEHAR